MHLLFLLLCVPVVSTLHEEGVLVLVAATQTCLVNFNPWAEHSRERFQLQGPQIFSRSPSVIILGFQPGKA